MNFARISECALSGPKSVVPLDHDLYDLRVKMTLLGLNPKAVVEGRYVFGTHDDGEESRHRKTLRRVFEESADAVRKSAPFNGSASPSWPTRSAKATELAGRGLPGALGATATYLNRVDFF